MGTMRERQKVVQLYRGQIPSPGAPTVAWREDRVRFWDAIARGESGVEHAGVQQEVLRLLEGLKLPLNEAGRRRSAARQEWFAALRNPLEVPDFIRA